MKTYKTSTFGLWKNIHVQSIDFPKVVFRKGAF